MALETALETGYGFWDPLVWILAVAIAAAVAYLIWRAGEEGYKRGTAQTEAFLSGNVQPEKGAIHVRAGNLYWGFLEALAQYYRRTVPVHTGVLNDYVLWFLGITALIIVIIGLMP
ncbi:MAG: hydrogenase [Methanomicrobiales archaeon]|nr:hydrogenase [Methanomicrobiales archaeon]MDI6877183.1 hydrogenase [Methanomicrobiales archaeon]